MRKTYGRTVSFDGLLPSHLIHQPKPNDSLWAPSQSLTQLARIAPLSDMMKVVEVPLAIPPPNYGELKIPPVLLGL